MQVEGVCTKVWSGCVGENCSEQCCFMEKTWRTELPWWISPFTEINWIDAEDPRGAENCSAMDENPHRASAPTSSQAYLFYS